MHFLKKYLNNNILKERLKCNIYIYIYIYISESTVNTVFVAEAFGLISSSLTTYSTKYLFSLSSTISSSSPLYIWRIGYGAEQSHTRTH